MSSSSNSTKLSLRELAVLAILGALCFALKLVMAVLPNIEPVTLILTLTTLVYGRKAFYTCYVYVLLEALVYGFGLWWFAYLYVWAILILLILPLRKRENYLLLTVVCTGFGLCFGGLCSLVYLVTGGPAMAFSWWIAGIPYDLLHAAGNAVMAALLLRPLHRLTEKMNIF